MPSESPSFSAPLEHQHMLSSAISLHRALRAKNRSQKFQRSLALDIAKGMKAADQNTKAFRLPEHTIKALSDRPPKPSDSRRCYRCGRTNHGPADCKFRDAVSFLQKDGTYRTSMPLETTRYAGEEKARSSTPTRPIIVP